MNDHSNKSPLGKELERSEWLKLITFNMHLKMCSNFKKHKEEEEIIELFSDNSKLIMTTKGAIIVEANIKYDQKPEIK